jgi:hypothetical protein
MHAFMSTRASRRCTKRSAPGQPSCMMHLAVDPSSVTALRVMVMRLCPDQLHFIRVQVCPGGGLTRVWLCVSVEAAPQLDAALRTALPGSAFGRISWPASLLAGHGALQ